MGPAAELAGPDADCCCHHAPTSSRTSMHPHWLGIVGVLAVAACRDRAAPTPRDVSLGPASTTPDRPLVTLPPGDPTRCAQLWPAHVAVRGWLHHEVHLGPPGYAETPRQDRRDTVLVLAFPAPLVVCVDSVDRPGRPAVVGVSRIQLNRSPAEAPANAQVTVVGTMMPAAYGWHYTPVVL